jgi:hypothetical protein
VEAKEEEKIINLRINSDDFLQIFGMLLTMQTQVPSGIIKSISKEIIVDISNRIVQLNINNKEFLDAVQK